MKIIPIEGHLFQQDFDSLHSFFFFLTPESSSNKESEGSLISSCRNTVFFHLSQCFLISLYTVLKKTLQNINLKNFSIVRSLCVPPCHHQTKKKEKKHFYYFLRVLQMYIIYICKWGRYIFKLCTISRPHKICQ